MKVWNLSEPFDNNIEAALQWVTINWAWLFNGIDHGLSRAYNGLELLLQTPSLWFILLAVAVLGWWFVHLRFALLATLGLLACAVMGLWSETMSTLTLLISSVVIALLIAIPLGILAGLQPHLNNKVQLCMDVMQTMPPYLYLLPAVALIGYGPSTAMFATILVAIPPALRLTALGIRLTPKEFIELGRANGVSPIQMLIKIRLPIARRSIMMGINQSLMVGVGMVVLGGIVGSGGLGFTLYEAIRTLDIGKAIDGGIAIVIITMVLDRSSQAFGSNDIQRGTP